MPRNRQMRKNGRWFGLADMVVFALAFGLMPAAKGQATPADAAAPEMHAFTDPQGGTIKAVVLSIVGDEVNLKRVDGQSWSEPMAYFTAADQAYIVESQIGQRNAHGHPVFTISAVPISADQTNANIAGGVMLRWKEAYKINLKNETVMKLTDLRVRCVVFKTPLVPDVAGNYNLAIELHAQTLPLDEIGESATKSVLTDQLEMEGIQTRGGYFPMAPNAHAETDQLTAIWVRVYDRNNYLIQEWCSSPEIFKQGNWDEEWARGGGARSRGGDRVR